MVVVSALVVVVTLAQIVTFVGGSGGLAYLLERLVRVIGWFRNRPRLTVRILDEVHFGGRPLVQFEAQNLGVDPMALDPTVELSGLWLESGEIHRFDLRLIVDVSVDRSLDPHKPKQLSAVGTTDKAGHAFTFLWYRVYTFRATRGRPCHVYLRTIDGQPLSKIRCYWEAMQLRIPWTRDALLKRVRVRGGTLGGT